MSVYEKLTTELQEKYDDLVKKYNDVVWKATGTVIENPLDVEFEDILEAIEDFQEDMFDAGYDFGGQDGRHGTS